MTGLPPELCALAASQHGMFTTGQAARVGLGRRSLIAAVTAGELVHPGRGLYAVAHLVDHGTPEAWHRHLAAGAMLIYPDAALCGVTSVLAHGIGVWGCDLAKPSLRRPIHRSTGVTCFRVRRSRGAVVATEWGPASTVADSLVQLAVDHGIEQGVVSTDAALRQGLVTKADIDESIDRSTRAPGIHRARSMAAFVCVERESAGESRCGFALELAGIHVVPQVEIRDAFGTLVGRVDFLVEGTTVVVEFDGKLKFASGDPEVLWAEKKREDRLRALGYTVVRITWADLERGTAVAKVRAALAMAAAA
ncbi:type IV toxin-antitoxin system AbiEi family antitoxin domain-containing protein [Knoellia sp. LjRoot47]|uniref:type IV toxin-antitoxin system AbiEi family antitoxin domain-containing protein n=1 Tax=Knoellia sp. LjRoot47 TaxID=3342330 RepID=UPI003ED01735